ncbi:unnamed protein product, partial [Allacma fusca]
MGRLNASQSLDFVVGSSQSLNCSVTGFPMPQILWFRNNISIPRTVEANETILIFPEVLYSHSGIYTCRATNFVGTVTSEFKVTTKIDLLESANQDIMIGFSIAACVGVVIFVVLSLVFWRRIQKQKKLLRQLTEEEIAEFELGNPEAVNTDENTNNQGHLLAYNMAYEFP